MTESHNLSLMCSDKNPEKSGLINAYVLPGAVLDIGCGNGLYAFDYENKATEILQVDLVDRRSPEARKFPFVCMDANNLDFETGRFDNVIAFDIAEHLDNDIAFFDSVCRILKPGGRLLLSVPNQDNDVLAVLNLAHIHFMDKTHKREYTLASLRNALEEGGFKALQISPQINKAIASVPNILSRENILSRFVAQFISLQMRFCIKAGLLKNEICPDWFCVAERK